MFRMLTEALVNSKIQHKLLVVFGAFMVLGALLTAFSTSTVNTILSSCVFAFALLMYAVMPRLVKKPVADMQAAIKEIAGGNLTYPIRSGRKDELGGLADSHPRITAYAVSILKSKSKSTRFWLMIITSVIIFYCVFGFCAVYYIVHIYV